MISMPGSASTSSGNVGPHMLSRAVVVTMMGSFSALAALARATTLCFSSPAVPSNDEISPGVSWRLTRATRYPLDPPDVAQFLGPGNWLISKVRVSSPDRAGDAINLVAATVDVPAGIVEYAIFGEDLVDGRAPTRGVVFTEDIVKIAGQQGRYAIRHGCLLSNQ